MLTTIVVTVILGAIIGVLARLVLPGRQDISTLMTVLLGIVAFGPTWRRRACSPMRILTGLRLSSISWSMPRPAT